MEEMNVWHRERERDVMYFLVMISTVWLLRRPSPPVEFTAAWWI